MSSVNKLISALSGCEDCVSAVRMRHVGRSTVYELLRTGKLKGVKFGRAHRVVVQSIRDLVEES